MKIAIVGSREFGNLALVVDFVNALPVGTVIVTGGARGVDKAAEFAARARGLEVVLFLPDWRAYGRSAGMRRNVLIVDEAEVIVAFWDGKSKGTAHSIAKAIEAQKSLFTFTPGSGAAKIAEAKNFIAFLALTS